MVIEIVWDQDVVDVFQGVYVGVFQVLCFQLFQVDFGVLVQVVVFECFVYGFVGVLVVYVFVDYGDGDFIEWMQCGIYGGFLFGEVGWIGFVVEFELVDDDFVQFLFVQVYWDVVQYIYVWYVDYCLFGDVGELGDFVVFGFWYDLFGVVQQYVWLDVD